MLRVALAIFALTLAAAGCDRSGSAPVKVNPGQGRGAPTTRFTGRGSVTGVVALTHWKHPPAAIPADCCSLKPGDKVDESVMPGPDNGLANVVLHVKEAPPTARPTPTTPVVLDQVKCRYVPHVVALRTNQPLVVKSSDDTLHNVHLKSADNPAVNDGFRGRERRTYSFKHPERFAAACDVHPWMKAHVAVFDHDAFAVSGPDGRFIIDNLPPGTWTLVAWHERLGELQQQFTVADGSPPATVSLSYGPPQ
jgi:hypothetical protein